MYNSGHKYDDIINLPRPVSQNHRPMPMTDRAAQFSPFAALVGYDEAVDETTRLTDSRLELDEDRIAELNDKLNFLRDNISCRPEITVTYFVPDDKKTGGKYAAVTGNIRIIDDHERNIVFTAGECIKLDDILYIESNIFDNMQ